MRKLLVVALAAGAVGCGGSGGEDAAALEHLGSCGASWAGADPVPDLCAAGCYNDSLGTGTDSTCSAQYEDGDGDEHAIGCSLIVVVDGISGCCKYILGGDQSIAAFAECEGQ